LFQVFSETKIFLIVSDSEASISVSQC